MIFNLIDYFRDSLEQSTFGFLRVFRYPEFRAVLAIILSFVIVVLIGKRTIAALVKLKIGDSPEFNHAHLNEIMEDKKNTPTMGGVMIIAAVLAVTLLLANLANFYVIMAIVCMLWLTVLGGIDDFLKLTASRRAPDSRDGLKSWEKLVFQIGLAFLLGLFIYNWNMSKFTLDFPAIRNMSHSLTLPFTKSWTWDHEAGAWMPASDLIVLTQFAFVFIVVLVMTSSSNAVNLTDGMDGLAGGIMSIVAFAFMVLALIAGEEKWAKQLLLPYIPMSNELAVIAGAMVGACLGFLWFNCSPAQVFMGDTGSLPLGGLIGFIAVVIRQEFMLLIVGGIFVFEAVSVILQVGSYKLRGKRVFRCAPIHHHFQLGGMPERKVVVRFWVATIVLVAVALATIKIR